MVEITSKEQISEAMYKHQLTKVEQQLIQSAREKFQLIARINQLEEQLSLRPDLAKNLSTVMEAVVEPESVVNASIVSQTKLVSFEQDCDDIESILSLKPDKFSEDSEESSWLLISVFVLY